MDSAGNIYIAGVTATTDLDTVSAFQPNFGGQSMGTVITGDGFVAKFSPTGTLLYLTYIGGSQNDGVTAIAVDAAGDAYLAGATTSTNFPIVGGYQTQYGGGHTHRELYSHGRCIRRQAESHRE
jgi:secreted protein with Ig-like and vWFA domain